MGVTMTTDALVANIEARLVLLEQSVEDATHHRRAYFRDTAERLGALDDRLRQVEETAAAAAGIADAVYENPVFKVLDLVKDVTEAWWRFRR